MTTKRLFTILLISLITILTSYSFTSDYSRLNSNAFNLRLQKVYVCGGTYTEKFYSYPRCRGLNNCQGGIYYYDSLQEAINNGFDYCSICWE